MFIILCNNSWEATDIEPFLTAASSFINTWLSRIKPSTSKASFSVKSNLSAKSLLARCLLRSDQLSEAENLINNISPDAEKNQDYVSVRSEVEIFKNAKNNPISNKQEEELKESIKNNPKNYQLKLDLSKLLIAKGENENAINELLEIIEVDAKWSDGAARKQLIEIFNILGNENILVIEGRKKLSSMLFS